MAQQALRLLLADDEASVREPLAKYLSRTYGYKIDTAGNAQAVLLLLAETQGNYDVVLIDDLLMPTADQEPEPLGVVLTKEIKARYDQIEVIVFTGWGLKSGDVLQAGAYRYLSKPFNLDELGFIIESAAEFGRLRSIVREKQILEQLMQSSTALISGQSQMEVLHTILHGVQAIGFDRVCLYLLTDDRQTMVGQAQVGMSPKFVGHQRAVAGDKQMQSLLLEPRPQIFQRENEPLLPHEHTLEREAVTEWACVPLVLEGEVIGKLSIDNKFSRRPILEAELEPVALFASQAAAAIHNAQLRKKEKEATLVAERRARDLEAIQEVAATINSLLDLDQVLVEVCRAAVDLFGVSHSGLVLFEEATYEFGRVVAEYPDLGTLDLIIPIKGIEAEERLIALCQPWVIPDVSVETGLGAVLEIFEQFDVRSILIAPVVFKGQVLGSFSLDAIGQQRLFTADEIEMFKILAAQVSVAISNARLFAEAKRDKQLLVTLDEISRHILAEKETFKLLQQVVRLAAELLDCTKGAMFINRPQLQELAVNVEYGLSPDLYESPLTHEEGLVGWVARTAQLQVVQDYRHWAGRELLFEDYQFEVAVGVPLIIDGEVSAVLFVADTKARPISAMDQDVLQRFAANAALALQTSLLLSREQRTFTRLAMLHKISTYIQAAKDLDKILHIVLTGITAGYGLGFNRAALFLVDERRRHLVGRIGIGHLNKTLAKRDWAQDHRHDLFNLRRYLEHLEQGALAPTPLNQRICQLHLPIAEPADDLFSRVLVEQKFCLATPQDLSRLPEPFVQAFEPAVPLVVVPLVAREQVIGLLVADHKFTHAPITAEDIEALLTFVNTAAVVMDNTRLFEETIKARERLSASFTASNALVSFQPPEQVLWDIVNQAQTTPGACGANMALIDDLGYLRDLVASGVDRDLDPEQMIRPTGLSMGVMATGRPEIIEDTFERRAEVNPTVFTRGIGAAVGLPVSVEGKPIGVMWINYRQPRYFPPDEIEALQLYVNQAAIAYDSARRIKELEGLRQAAEALSGVAELPEMLEQIVRSACAVLQADSAAILSYDSVRDRFIVEESVAAGFPTGLWTKHLKATPRQGQTVSTVLDRGWVGITDVRDTAKYDFLGDSTRNLLNELKVASFQAIALTAESEKLGVLYVNYERPRSFNRAEQKAAQTFANHAALALKKVRLLDQVAKTRNAAYVVANAMVLENLHNTLESLVEGTRQVLGCDATVLYTYDQDQAKMGYPPITTGLYYPEKTRLFAQFPQEHYIFDWLDQELPYLVEDISTDPILANRRFALDEEIKSCVVSSLRVGERAVGLIFFNYRHRHCFTEDELNDIRLFANQAAVAIRNAQLYDRIRKRAGMRQALYEAARVITRSLDLDEILTAIAAQACKVTGAARFSHIGLVEEDKLKFTTAFPTEQLTRLSPVTIDLTGVPAGISGQAVSLRRSQLVGDVTREPNYIAFAPGTRSELAVPIVFGDQVTGVINVEHTEYNAFSDDDRYALEALAAQAAIAIQNARLYDQLQKRVRVLEALYTAGRVLTMSLELDEILKRIAEQAWTITRHRGTQISFACIRFVEHNKTRVIAVYPPDQESLVQYASGSEIDLTHGVEGRIGIMGRVALTGESILVNDVLTHPDYLKTHEATRSELAVPVKLGQNVIGVINVEHSSENAFGQEDLRALEALATQAALVIENAGLFKQAKERLSESNMLKQVAVSLAGTSALNAILELVLQEAIDLTGTQQGFVLLIESGTKKLTHCFKFEEEQLEPCYGQVQQNGFTHKTLNSQEPIVISDLDAAGQTTALLMAEGVRAVVGVPLLNRGEALGVLYVCSRQVCHFSERQVDILVALAGQATVAIDRALQFEELKRTKGLVGARTALAWMGMVSSVWRHAIDGHALTIQEEAELLQSDLARHNLGRIERRVEKIRQLAHRIFDKPITPPLSDEEGVSSVYLNNLIRERVKQLWENEPYALTQVQLDLTLDEATTVRASPEWLQHIFDVLIDNAIDSMKTMDQSLLTISTTALGDRVKIVFTDVGSGIPQRIQQYLLKLPIEKATGEKGMGMGLLMALTIAETYGGELRIGTSGPHGTSMIVEMPIERQLPCSG